MVELQIQFCILDALERPLNQFTRPFVAKKLTFISTIKSSLFHLFTYYFKIWRYISHNTKIIALEKKVLRFFLPSFFIVPSYYL